MNNNPIITYVFYIWLNDKITKKQELRTRQAKNILNWIVCDYFWGGTISEVNGVYTHEDGTLVKENTLKCEVATNISMDTILEFIQHCKNRFNQESIMLQKPAVTTDFL